FKPCLVLPAQLLPRLSREDVRHVFLHELAHLKRLDAAWSWLLAVLQAVHWPNPLVWWAFARAREERELACDARALLASAGEAAAGYGDTLIRLVEAVSRRPRAPSLTPGIHEGRRSIERRIEMISRFEFARKPGTALAIALIGACAAAGLTSPQEPSRRRAGPRPPEAAKTPVDPDVPTMALLDVGPLLRVNPDFEAPRLGVVIGPDERKAPAAPPPSAEELGRERRKKVEALAALIRSQVSPRTWGERWQVLPTDGAQIILEAPHGVVEEAQGFVRKLIAERETLIHLDLTLVTLGPRAIEELPQGLRGKIRPTPPPGGPPWRPPSLLQEEVDHLLERGRAEGSVVKRLPALSAWDGQLAHNLVASEEAIIADIKVTGVNENRKAEPIIGVLRTGVVTQVRPALSVDQKRLNLSIGIETADVRRPIQAVVVEGSPVSLPELSLRQFNTSVDAAVGDWVLVSGLSTAAGEPGLLVLKASLIKPQAKD
ncbi:MAG: M56 family metallopeptidase, partial [Thermoanaerobaculia bacterium]